jgi:pimeloyl-ACP methyl ester carboxylesterase
VGGAVARAFLAPPRNVQRLLCFDKRGSGVSDPVPLATLPTLEEWMDDVRTVMDAAGSDPHRLDADGDGIGCER